MTTETELRLQGMKVLIGAMGMIEAERFVAAINRERFNYTQWRQQGLPELSIDEIAARANTLSASLNANPDP
ncbi:hypothetical protein [uncultured Thiodictyon sp.]|uniref:hypothetical protein n=1 Tax=uncultured Thiodictyon sp. TaxID=1846217 RepID=UPI0025E6BFF7|nr:hypothetical protein [uncultured Thiodictyon sp.]